MMTLTLALVLACGDKEPEDTSTASDGGAADGGASDGGATDGGAADGGTTDECVELPPTACEADEGCRALEAWLVRAEGEGWCVDFSKDRVALGCIAADAGCGDAETPATTADKPDQCLWLFPSTCLPPGYLSCPESSLPECP